MKKQIVARLWMVENSMDEDRIQTWLRHMPPYYSLCDKVNFSGQDTRYVTDKTG